jgi:hypothetical protein
MVLLTLPTSIPDGRRKAAFCCWCGDEAHAPSSNVSVSSSVVVFNPEAYSNLFVGATPVSSLPFVLFCRMYVQLNN